MSAVEQRPRTYPAATMLRARELREAGWYPTKIRELLTQEGLGSPSLFTIQIWTNPRYLSDHSSRVRRRGLERSSEASRFRLPGSSPEYVQAFIERLHAEGVSQNSIGAICGVVFGEALTENQIRYRLAKAKAARL